MAKFTEIHTIKLTREQKQTLNKLKLLNVNVNQFIRLAISEKIKRDYKKIKEGKDCPF